MLLTVVVLTIVLLSLAAYSQLGKKTEGKAYGNLGPVNDYPVVSRKRELPDAAASFLFIMVMATRAQRKSRK